MKISIITLFPEMFQGPFQNSILKHAQEKNLLEIRFINIRDFGIGKHKLVDDTPYGGGIGMVMRVDVIHKAVKFAQSDFGNKQKPTDQLTVLFSAGGKTFSQSVAQNFANTHHLILICGHYEGIDERIKNFIDMELSVGDFVLTGGEIPAMIVVDATARLLPGVLKDGATQNESFSISHEGKQILEYPHYTRPNEYEGYSVPDILLSGNHALIEQWRKEASLTKTKLVRPELLTED